MKHSFLERQSITSEAIQSLAKSSKYSHKLISMMAENASASIMVDHSLEMQGVPFMLDGLEYHHRRLKRMEKRMLADLRTRMAGGNETSRLGFDYIHEVRAYLNVIGQFIGSITSKWFLHYVAEGQLAVLCPRVFALVPFRNKDAAHRCIDKPDPRLEETDSQKESFSSLYCYTRWMGLNPKQYDSMQETVLQEEVLLMGEHLSYQAKIAARHRHRILTGQNVPLISGIERLSLAGEIFLCFIPVEQHPQIIAEAYSVIEAAFRFNSSL